MRTITAVVVVVSAVLLVCGGVSCLEVKGNIVDKGDWLFLDKFCFAPQGGNLTWTGWSQNTANLLLLLYDDAEDSWPAVWNQRHTLSCQQKVAMAKIKHSIVSGQTQVQSFKDEQNPRRPHFWYIAVSKCGGQGKLELQYQFTFTNPGGAWSRQFSFDQQGMPGMYLFFWLLFMVLSGVHLYSVYHLYRMGSLHPVVNILTTATIMATVSMFCFFLHYVIFAGNGVGAPGMQGLGEILDMASQLTLTFLLILLAKGWGITRHHIVGKNLVILLVSFFLLGYISLFVWDNVGRNPASTLYLYESVPGVLILILRFLTWLWFLWCLVHSFLEEHNPTKKKFYMVFGGVFTTWFLMLPLIVLLSLGIPPWYRFKVVTGMFLCLNTIGFASMIGLLWPTWAVQFFSAIDDPNKFLHSTSVYDTL